MEMNSGEGKEEGEPDVAGSTAWKKRKRRLRGRRTAGGDGQQAGEKESEEGERNRETEEWWTGLRRVAVECGGLWLASCGDVLLWKKKGRDKGEEARGSGLRFVGVVPADCGRWRPPEDVRPDASKLAEEDVAGQWEPFYSCCWCLGHVWAWHVWSRSSAGGAASLQRHAWRGWTHLRLLQGLLQLGSHLSGCRKMPLSRGWLAAGLAGGSSRSKAAGCLQHAWHGWRCCFPTRRGAAGAGRA